jgi:uncharacterized protein YndB with AHSA1/START domain
MTHDTQSRDTVEPIVVECDFDEPPEKVWRALTEPELLAAWLAPDSMHPAENGPHRLVFGEEQVTVELEAVSEEPPHLLRYRWGATEREGAIGERRLDSVVTFELTESESGGTHLRIVHDGFRMTVSEPVAPQAFARRQRTSCPRPLRRRRTTSMRLAA